MKTKITRERETMAQKKYTYLHIFNSQDFKFIPKLLNAIEGNDYVFKKGEHLFVTHYEKIYNLIKHHENVILTPFKGASIANKYGPFVDWIIIHSFNSAQEAILIKKNISKKVIWRTWGHDMYRNNETIFSLKYILKSLREYLFNKKVESFYAFAGANCIDEYNLSIQLKIKRFYRIPYVYEKGIEEWYQKVKENSISHKGLRILLGHSGDENNHHIDILKRIKPLIESDTQVILVLAYMADNNDYVENVKEFSRNELPDNIVLIEKFMSYKDYIAFLNTIDVAIFDSCNSYALGNIAILIKFGKTLYLNKDGIIHQALLKERFPHYCTDQLINSKQLKTLLKYSPNDYDNLCVESENVFFGLWDKLLNDLTQNNMKE